MRSPPWSRRRACPFGFQSNLNQTNVCCSGAWQGAVGVIHVNNCDFDRTCCPYVYVKSTNINPPCMKWITSLASLGFPYQKGPVGWDLHCQEFARTKSRWYTLMRERSSHPHMDRTFHQELLKYLHEDAPRRYSLADEVRSTTPD